MHTVVHRVQPCDEGTAGGIEGQEGRRRQAGAGGRADVLADGQKHREPDTGSLLPHGLARCAPIFFSQLLSRAHAACCVLDVQQVNSTIRRFCADLLDSGTDRRFEQVHLGPGEVNSSFRCWHADGPTERDTIIIFVIRLRRCIR